MLKADTTDRYFDFSTIEMIIPPEGKADQGENSPGPPW
jgi:hypothetical protein